MKRFFQASAFLVISMLSTVLHAEVAAPCLNPVVRETCIASCAPACLDPQFLGINAAYCIGKGIINRGPGDPPLEDGPNCQTYFAAGAGNVDAAAVPIPDPAPVSSGQSANDSVNRQVVGAEGEDCEKLEKLSEQRRCKLDKVGPKCSPTVTALEKRARLLVTSIKGELSKYGDLLTRDWRDVNNRERLCALGLNELDRNYEIATQNPDTLRASRREAQAIQSCQSEWEAFVRHHAGSNNSDSLVDTVAREAEAQLADLKGQIEELTRSIAKLEVVAGTIRDIVDVHIIYCDAAGQPPAADGSGPIPTAVTPN